MGGFVALRFVRRIELSHCTNMSAKNRTHASVSPVSAVVGDFILVNVNV